MGETLRVILIDDEMQAIQALESRLAGYPNLKICGRITDPGIAIPVIREVVPDLIFLDIEMPGKNGFEVLKEINDLGQAPWIIFVTAYDRFAIQAIRSAAFDYLLKPVDKQELDDALNRLFRLLGQSPKENGSPSISERMQKLIGETSVSGKIKISSSTGFLLLRPDDIFYILADWNYSDIYFSKTEHEMVTVNLGAVWKLLPQGLFYRLSRSLIINLNYLSRVNRKKRLAILTKNGDECAFTIPLLNLRKMEHYLDSNR